MASPEPLRLLGPAGRSLWDRIWSGAVIEHTPEALVELVQVLCEQTDERHGLRARVILEQSWRDRAALRALELQITGALTTVIDRMGAASDLSSSMFNELLAEMGDPT